MTKTTQLITRLVTGVLAAMYLLTAVSSPAAASPNSHTHVASPKSSVVTETRTQPENLDDSEPSDNYGAIDVTGINVSYHRDGNSLSFQWAATGFPGPVTYKIRAQHVLGCDLGTWTEATKTSHQCQITPEPDKPWGGCFTIEATDSTELSAKNWMCVGSRRSFFDYRIDYDIETFWLGYVELGTVVSAPAGLNKCFGDLTLDPVKVLCVKHTDAQKVKDRIIKAQTTQNDWPMIPNPDYVWIGNTGETVASDYDVTPFSTSLVIGEWLVPKNARCFGKKLTTATTGQQVKYCGFATIYGPRGVRFKVEIGTQTHNVERTGPAVGKKIGGYNTTYNDATQVTYQLISDDGTTITYTGRPFHSLFARDPNAIN